MEFVQLKICEQIAYITLNRSKVYNAINSEMVNQFSSCIEKIANACTEGKHIYNEKVKSGEITPNKEENDFLVST